MGKKHQNPQKLRIEAEAKRRKRQDPEQLEKEIAAMRKNVKTLNSLRGRQKARESEDLHICSNPEGKTNRGKIGLAGEQKKSN